MSVTYLNQKNCLLQPAAGLMKVDGISEEPKRYKGKWAIVKSFQEPLSSSFYIAHHEPVVTSLH